MKHIAALIVSLLVSFAAAAIGSQATRRAPEFYRGLSRPEWAPPASLFGPVWTILYILMAIAAWLVVGRVRDRADVRARAAQPRLVVRFMKSLRYATLTACALSACASAASAQQPAACDSTFVVQRDLAEQTAFLKELEWLPSGASIELLLERPTPTNRIALARELVRRYPSHLRDRHIGGEVTFAVLVDTTGAVRDERLLRSSGYAEFDRAADPIISKMRFEPFRLVAGCAVPALLRMPIVFKTIP